MKRFTVRKLMIAVAVLAVLLGLCIIPIGRQAEWSRLNREVFEAIGRMKPSNPASLAPGVWECAHGWTTIANMNVCYSSDGVSLGEMHRLRDDLNAKLKGHVDLDTLVWIWDRLAKTGPHGKRYIERFKPQFLKCFPAAANATK